MNELVYAEDRKDYEELRDLIEKAYPDLTIKDASDCVHPHRFSVDGDVDEDAFYKMAIREGFFTAMLGANLLMSTDSDRVKRLIEELKEES